MQSRDEVQEFPHVHLGIQRVVFGQVAHAPFECVVHCADVLPVEGHRAGICGQVAEDGAHEGGLAGAVGAEQSHDLPAGHGHGLTLSRAFCGPYFLVMPDTSRSMSPQVRMRGISANLHPCRNRIQESYFDRRANGSMSNRPKAGAWNAGCAAKFRMEGLRTTNPVAVGDGVTWIEEEDGTGVITEIAPRRNRIIRRSVNLSHEAHVVAANVDRAWLVVTLGGARDIQWFRGPLFGDGRGVWCAHDAAVQQGRCAVAVGRRGRGDCWLRG